METIIRYQTIEEESREPLTVFLPSGKTIFALPFQKSNGLWYVRFSSSEVGIIRLSNEKTYRVVPYEGENKLFFHGPIKVSGRHLVHDDGAPFFYLADTWWYGMTNRASRSDLERLLKDRKKKGFTAVQCVVGVPPEIPFFSHEAENDGGHPLTKEFEINPSYFDEVDKRIQMILEYGMTPCIFGGWGHHIDIIGVSGAIRLWKEIVARYASYPVLFCLTGEADLFWRVSRWRDLFSSLFLRKHIAKWSRVGQWIKRHDPYGRILMVHPHRRVRAFVLFHRPSWLDIDSIQSGHSEDGRSFMISALEEAQREGVPIINLEPWYEGIRGNFGKEHQKEAIEISLCYGACGHAYGAHGVWQMANDDNFMGHWGESDWKTAYRFPGGALIGKIICERYNTKQ